MFFEGVTCACTRTRRASAIVLPAALASLRVPVLCCRTVVATERGRLPATPQWLSPAQLLEHFEGVEYSNVAFGNVPLEQAAAAPAARRHVDVCISGGLRTVVTGLCLLKRFLLDHVASYRVFALTWRDAAQGYSADAAQFVRDFFGTALQHYAEFDDADAAVHAAERERVRAAYATRATAPGALRLAFVPELWFRRQICNDMRKSAPAPECPDALVFRTRFDTFLTTIPPFHVVKPGVAVGAVDLFLLATPQDADVEVGLANVFPAHHEHVIAGMSPREAAMWEFGSEAHVLYHLRAAGVQIIDNFRLGRFGRTCSGGVVDEKTRPLQFPTCPILNTAAVLY